MTRRLTWTKLATGDLLCNEYPVLLVKPQSRRADDPGWLVRTPVEPDANFPDGWRWGTVNADGEAWPMEAGTARAARSMVAADLDRILAEVDEGFPLAESRTHLIRHAEDAMAEHARRFGSEHRAAKPRKPSLRAAAVAVDEAWTRYLDDDDVDAMAAAIGRLREALA